MDKIVDTCRENTPGGVAAQVRAERGVMGGNSRGAAYWLIERIRSVGSVESVRFNSGSEAGILALTIARDYGSLR